MAILHLCLKKVYKYLAVLAKSYTFALAKRKQ